MGMGSEMMFPKDEVDVDGRGPPLPPRFFSLSGGGPRRRRRAQKRRRATPRPTPTRRPQREPMTMAVGKVPFLLSPSPLPLLLLLSPAGVVLAAMAVGITLGMAVAVDVGFGTGVDASSGALVWSESFVHCDRLLQLYPKGQQLSPQVASVPLRTVVLMEASGCATGSWRLMLHVMGEILSQLSPSGQQRTVVFPARVMHFLPAPQQKFPGRPLPQEVKPSAAHVLSCRPKTEGIEAA